MKRMKNGLVELILYIIAFAGAAIMLMPFVWMVDTSLKLPEEVQVWPPSWSTSNALSARNIPAAVDHSAYAGVNYAALSLQQFLTSGNGNSVTPPNLLTVKLVGTPPIRGTIHVLLSEGHGTPRYATSIDKKKFKEVVSKIDALTFPSKFKGNFSALKRMENTPTEYIKEFITIFKYSTNPILSRINFVNGVSKSVKTSQAFMERFGPILARNPRLKVEKGDSKELAAEKKEIESFFGSNEYMKETNSFLKRIEPFKKGLGTLAPDDTKLLKEFDFLLEKVDIQERLEKKYGSIDPSIASLVKVYEERAVRPIEEWMNLLIAFKDLENFYNSSKNLTVKNPEVVFTFVPLSKKRSELEGAFKSAGVSDYYLGIADRIVKSGKINDFSDELINELNAKVREDIRALGFTSQKAAFIFGKLSSVTSAMNVLYTSLSTTEQKEFNSLLDKYSSNFGLLAKKLNAAFSGSYPSSTAVVVGQLQSVDEYFSKVGKKKELEKLLKRSWEDQTAIATLTSIYNDVYYTMKILKAPSIVSKVQYFPSNGKIKIYFNGVNSVWFFDDTVHVRATFTFTQILANIFQNYVDAWNAAPFARYYFNTVFVATVTTILNIIVGVMAAFAFSKLHFKGRNFLFMLFLATMMIPGEVLLVPNFITIVKFGWFNTYYALIVPWIASAFVIFLMRQNFMSIPDELFDAAKIDGASKWRFLWTILVPLSRPVIITGALLNFVGSWNAFLWVLIVTNTPSMRTLPVGLQNFSSNAGTMYNQLMAASTFSMLPIVILFLFAQKYFIQGIARSGLK